MLTDKQIRKQRLNRQRHDFLLTFFDLPHKYEHKEVNGYVLVRQLNNANSTPAWEVAIYPKDHFVSKDNGDLFQEEAETTSKAVE